MKKSLSFRQAVSHDEHEAVVVYGTNRSDVITVGGGSQHVIAGNGNDVVSAGGGPDVVEGQNGRDTLIGGGGPDKLFGGNGNDFISGGPGPDELDGGNGRDIIDGGAAFDTMTGGRGKDVFIFTGHSEEEGGHETGILIGETGGDESHAKPMDTITYFKPGVDKIDFSGLEGVEAFSSDPAAHSVWVEQDGNNAIVRVDTNGDLTGEHGAELSILLLNVDAGSLSASDFLLS